MRYTHFGVGHSPVLRRITRDSLGSGLVAQPDGIPNSISEEADHEEACDDNGYEECADEIEDDDDDIEGLEESDNESSDGELHEGGENENEGYEDGDEFDEFDGLSF
jgi:hypothetical protein